MQYLRPLALGLLLLACSITEAPASFFQTSASKMDLMFKAEAPPGWRRLINTSSTSWTGPEEVVRWTSDRYTELSAVQALVNREITYLPDPGDDVWRVAVEAGDCEDFALRYRLELLKKGWPAGALRMAVVQDLAGTVHALLTVETTAGTWVVDSLYDGVLPWTAYPYRWLIREAPGGEWFIIRRQENR